MSRVDGGADFGARPPGPSFPSIGLISTADDRPDDVSDPRARPLCIPQSPNHVAAWQPRNFARTNPLNCA